MYQKKICLRFLNVLWHLLQVLKTAKEALLWCATPDGVLRAKDNFSPEEFVFVESTYFQQQKHENLLVYLDQRINGEKCKELFAQVHTLNDRQFTFTLFIVDILFFYAWKKKPWYQNC